MSFLIRRLIGWMFGPAFRGDGLPLHLVLRCLISQKVLLQNRKVPWPVHCTSKVMAPSNIDRGSRYPGLSMGCHIDGRNGIKFGRNVWVGPRCSIISMNHNAQNFEKFIVGQPIIIGDNCWLATNCTVLHGVELAEHTIVAAGAVVTKSFLEGNVVLAGIPARIVKRLPPYGVESFDE